MDKQQQKKDLIPYLIVGALIIAIFIFSICVYLNSTECYGLMGGPQKCITGWETLKLEWPSFWTWVTICSIIGAACFVVAVYNETGAGKLGKKLRGKTNITWVLILLSLLLFTCPWGKACTDKSNAGITAPGHKVETTNK
jgi:hypothetical protein